MYPKNHPNLDRFRIETYGFGKTPILRKPHIQKEKKIDSTETLNWTQKDTWGLTDKIWFVREMR